jgi:hypothetical protein
MTMSGFPSHAQRWRILGWGAAGAILLLPLLAMLVTDEMAWGAEDFLAAALLFGSAGLAFELAVRVVRGRGARVAVGLAILAALLLVWAELAVGLFH